MKFFSHEDTKTRRKEGVFQLFRGARPPRAQSGAPRAGHVGRETFKKVNILQNANAGTLKNSKQKPNPSRFVTRCVSDARARRTAPGAGALPGRIGALCVLFVLFVPFAPSVFAQTNTHVLTLADAQKIALRNHPEISAANYRALAAREVAKQARSGFFPQASLYVNATAVNDEGSRILAGGLNNPSLYSRAAGGLQVNQLLTDFGHTANLAASASLQARAANQNANLTREQVLLLVNVSFYNVLKAQAVQRVTEQTLAMRNLLLDQISVLAANKLKSDLDVSFARVDVEKARLLMEKAQNDSLAAMTTLSTALGFREPRTFQIVDVSQKKTIAMPTNAMSQWVSTALAARPELLSLRHERDAALRYARSQRDARLPTLSAVGVAGYAPVRDNGVKDNYAAGGVQVSLPLFAGGLYKARQREAELRAQANAELLRAAEDDIVRDVHLAALNLNTVIEQFETTKVLVQSAAEARELADARYKAGSSSITALSQAQLNLASAQIAEANARYDVFIQEANLNYEIGALR